MGYAKKLMPEDFPEHWAEPLKDLYKRYDASHKVIQRWRRELGHENLNKKQVMQFDKDDGRLIAIYDSLVDAGNAMYISYTAIGQCCRRKSRTSCGYIWRFADDAEDMLNV